MTIVIIGSGIRGLVTALSAYKNGATCVIIIDKKENAMDIKSGEDISNIEREWIDLLLDQFITIQSKEPDRLKLIHNATVTQINQDGLVYHQNNESHYMTSPLIITTVPFVFEKRAGVIDISKEDTSTTFDKLDSRHLLKLFSDENRLLSGLLNQGSSVILKNIKLGFIAGQSASTVSAQHRLQLISNHLIQPVYYTREQVAQHNTEEDCWLIVNGDVINATLFLNEHPGGRRAILLYAGRDASREFNMLHQSDVVQNYSPESIIGKVA